LGDAYVLFLVSSHFLSFSFSETIILPFVSLNVLRQSISQSFLLATLTIAFGCLAGAEFTQNATSILSSAFRMEHSFIFFTTGQQRLAALSVSWGR
jgi:hypothetical protein